jgi:hypothetical protein
MISTVYYIKRIVARNVEAWRAKSDMLIAYQKNLVAENHIDE